MRQFFPTDPVDKRNSQCWSAGTFSGRLDTTTLPTRSPDGVVVGPQAGMPRVRRLLRPKSVAEITPVPRQSRSLPPGRRPRPAHYVEVVADDVPRHDEARLDVEPPRCRRCNGNGAFAYGDLDGLLRSRATKLVKARLRSPGTTLQAVVFSRDRLETIGSRSDGFSVGGSERLGEGFGHGDES